MAVLREISRDIVEELCTGKLAESISHALKTVAENGATTAALAGLLTPGWPVAVGALLLHGGIHLKEHKDKEAEEKKRAAELETLVRGAGQGKKDAIEALAERLEPYITNQKPFDARLPGYEKAGVAKQVSERVSARLREDLAALLGERDLMNEERDKELRTLAWTADWKLTTLIASTERIERDTGLIPGVDRKLDDLAVQVGKLTEFLANKQAAPSDSAGVSQAPTIPPDVETAARIVRARTTDQIERVRAQIVLSTLSGEFGEVDRLLTELRAHEAIAHTFDILTLEGDRWYYANEFDKAIEPYETAWRLQPKNFRARMNLALSLQQSRLADRRNHLRCAIDLHKGTLDLVPHRSPEWAGVQNNLAIALRSLALASEGPERARLLGEAVDAYRAALTVYTHDVLPQDWAMTQNNLGATLNDQAWASEGSQRARLLGEAVHACRAALTVYTRDALPHDWAMTQNNLGNALSDQALASEGPERARLLGEAVDAYRAALTVYTRDALPQDWAMTQNNLAASLRDQAAACNGRERARLLGEAVDAYRAALTVYVSDVLPQQWAMTQNNLAVALREQALATEGPERARLLSEAVDACRRALEVRTRAALPQGWAMTQYNLALAQAALAEVRPGERCELLRQAIACGKGALKVYTREHFPTQHAGASQNLEIDRHSYEASCATDISFDQIKPAE